MALHPGGKSPGTGEGVPGDARVAGAGRDLALRSPLELWCCWSVPGAAVSAAAAGAVLVEVGEVLLGGGVVVAPAGGLPDLDAVHRADHDHVAADRGVLAQRHRDRDPALLVGHDLLGAREEHADLVTPAARGHPLGAGAVGLLHEHVRREDVEALLLPLCHHEPLRQSVPELGREDQPPLVVELGGVGAHEEHRAPPRFLLDPPLSPTLLHFPPPSTTNHHNPPVEPRADKPGRVAPIARPATDVGRAAPGHPGRQPGAGSAATRCRAQRAPGDRPHGRDDRAAASASEPGARERSERRRGLGPKSPG